jgi:predicted DNA-binding transcriptional regulator YafY
MTAAQLATELEVSPRTILRDIEALSAAGFPVYAVRGSMGGFELLAGSSVQLPAGRSKPHQAWPSGASQRARVRISPRGMQMAALSGQLAGLRVVRCGRRPASRSGWIEAWLPVSSPRAAVADILALGSEAEVVEPTELRDYVRQTALHIADLHRST